MRAKEYSVSYSFSVWTHSKVDSYRMKPGTGFNTLMGFAREENHIVTDQQFDLFFYPFCDKMIEPDKTHNRVTNHL